ncbi:MAG: NAD-dependent epimerase/dehydratase family protein [bacterium]
MELAVTGISSYLARTLIPLLEADESIRSITGFDLKEPRFRSDKLEFIKADVRDPELAVHMQGCDALVHLAYIVMPIRDEAKADDININGSKNVFRCAARAGVKKIVHLSSVAAYGSWPDNPALITEDVPVRGMPGFYYSRSKAAVEEFLDEFEKDHPELVITRLRPSIFVGPTINNAITAVMSARLLARLRGLENKLQLTWDEDVARAIHLALGGDFHGAYNIAGDGFITMDDMAGIRGVPCITLPYSLALWLSRITWTLRLGTLSSGWIEVTRHPIIVSNEKAKREMGWTPSCDTRGALIKLLETMPGTR